MVWVAWRVLRACFGWHGTCVAWMTFQHTDRVTDSHGVVLVTIFTTAGRRERIFIEFMTSDCKVEASREGSKCRNYET